MFHRKGLGEFADDLDAPDRYRERKAVLEAWSPFGRDRSQVAVMASCKLVPVGKDENDGFDAELPNLGFG